MCKVTQEVRKIAKQPDVVKAAGDFGMAAENLARLIKGGVGFNPAQKRQMSGMVKSQKRFGELKRAHG